MHDGWKECQQACQFITECKWWTYYGDTVADKLKANHCELKHDDDADLDVDMVGAFQDQEFAQLVDPNFKHNMFSFALLT